MTLPLYNSLYSIMSTTQSKLVYPPLDYSVTLADAVDFNIEHNPTSPIYTFSKDGKSGITDISFLEFGRATHRAAHHIRPAREGPDRETIAFVALADSLLYQAVTLGIVRAGYIVSSKQQSVSTHKYSLLYSAFPNVPAQYLRGDCPTHEGYIVP